MGIIMTQTRKKMKTNTVCHNHRLEPQVFWQDRAFSGACGLWDLLQGPVDSGAFSLSPVDYWGLWNMGISSWVLVDYGAYPRGSCGL